MSGDKFLSTVRSLISERYEDKVSPEEVYIVWYCKTLQNHKALASTPVPDGLYYEITYNGDKQEMYLDTYKKVCNDAIKE